MIPTKDIRNWLEQYLDPAEFADSLATIDQSMEDIKAGRVRPMEETMRGLARKYGLNLNQSPPPGSPDA